MFLKKGMIFLFDFCGKSGYNASWKVTDEAQGQRVRFGRKQPNFDASGRAPSS